MKASLVAAPPLAVLLSACFGLGAPPSGGPLVPSFETPLFAPSPGITLDEALVAAHEAAPQTAGYGVAVHEYVPAAELHPSFIALNVPADRWVWYLVFNDPAGPYGAFVIVDYLDGTVHEVIETIE